LVGEVVQGDLQLARRDVDVDAIDEELHQVAALFGHENLPDLGEVGEQVEGALHPTDGGTEAPKTIIELIGLQTLLIDRELDLGEAIGDGGARLAAGLADEGEQV